MAASTVQISAPLLSQKQRRAALRKERRKRKRQALAQAREGLNSEECYSPEDKDDEEDEGNDIAELERLRLHEEWLEKERLAQEEFRLRCEREEAARKRKEEEERMIKQEWEAQQRREQEQKELKQQEKRDREHKQPSTPLTKDTYKEKKPSALTTRTHAEEAVQKMLDEAENQLDNGGQWMNPEAPVTENYGTERDVANCPFFLKTGACRFGDRCSRKHVYPTASPTLMIRGMFTTFGMEETRRDDYDIDAWLEHSEEDLQESFLEFYHDVLPELRSVGRVVQFKVSCNYEPHLRGNVYIQFDTEAQCKEALIKFNGRWYAGRQLHCEMCPVTRWKNAICGLFDRQKCPKGKHCNFLHVFRNPGNEFWEADRDLHLSPDRSIRGTHRDGWHSERARDRSRRQRHCSRSPSRSHSRREDKRGRSRSRERRASQHVREEKWSSRSRHTDRRNDLSSSRDRSRSRSKDRERDRMRNRNKDSYRNRSEEQDHRYKDSDTLRKVREKSRSSSRERKRNNHSRERSAKKRNKTERTPSDETKTHRHHTQSKKSKKKSKKHKKKSHLPEGMTSSGESDKEKESDGETVKNLTATGPSQEIPEAEPMEENNDLDGNHSVDSGKGLVPRGKVKNLTQKWEGSLLERMRPVPLSGSYKRK